MANCISIRVCIALLVHMAAGKFASLSSESSEIVPEIVKIKPFREFLKFLKDFTTGLLEELEIDNAIASSQTSGNGPMLAIDQDLKTFYKSKQGTEDGYPSLKVYLKRPAVVLAVKVVNKYETLTKFCQNEENHCALPINRTEVLLHENDGGEY